MPTLAEHTSSRFVKLLFAGASGAGKTGALVSLVEAGYKLRIIDLDSGLDAFKNLVMDKCPDKATSIQYNTFRDKMKMGPTGPKVVGAPKAYVNTLQALESWPDDNSDPAEWGEDTVLVIDSLTNVGRASFQWARAANPASKDPRQWYKVAQDLVEDLIANVTSEAFETNVIVISHLERTDYQGIQKDFVSAIGKALGPKLPRFFNTLILSETKGSGERLKRTIKTIPTTLMDLKTPAPSRIAAEYDLTDGLAKIFEELKK